MIKQLLVFSIILLFIPSPLFISQLPSQQRIIIYVSDNSVSQISNELEVNSLIGSQLHTELKLEAIDIGHGLTNYLLCIEFQSQIINNCRDESLFRHLYRN